MIDQFATSNIGRVLIKPLKPKTFKAYPFIIAIMAVLQLSSIIYSRCFIDFLFGFKITLGPLMFTPLILYIFQIVSECYGWQYARQIVWCNVCVNLLFTFIICIAKSIQLSTFTHVELRESYIHLMNTMWVTSLGMSIAVFCADYFATVFMSQSKFYSKGRMLLIRLLIVHCGTELILLSGALIQMPYNGYTMEETYRSMWQMFIARAISASCLAPFAIFAIWFIQNRIEKVVSFDSKKSWNIFKWSIQPQNTVQFDARQWSCLSIKDKLQVDIPVLTVEYYAIAKMSEGYYEYVTRSRAISNGS